MIRKRNIQLAAEVYKLPQRFVGVVAVKQGVVVDDQIIAGAVAHQHIAVAVENLSPRRRDPGRIGVAPGGLLRLGGVHHLHPEQPPDIQPQQHRKQGQKHADAEFCLILHDLLPFYR